MVFFPDISETGPSSGDVQDHVLWIAGVSCIGGNSLPLPTSCFAFDLALAQIEKHHSVGPTLRNLQVT